MSRYITLTMSNSMKSGVKKRSAYGGFRTGPVTLAFVTIILICLLGMFYLFTTNNTSTKGYKLKELEKRIAELEKENKTLGTKAVELQSFEKIKDSTQKLNMVKTAEISFVPQTQDAVAVNR